MDKIIIEKTYTFNIKIVKLYKKLVAQYGDLSLFSKLLSSGTSIGLYAEEAIGGISKQRQAPKLIIALNQARETHYWLRTLSDTGFIEEHNYHKLINECEEILNALFTIIRTAKEK